MMTLSKRVIEFSFGKIMITATIYEHVPMWSGCFTNTRGWNSLQTVKVLRVLAKN